MMKDARGTVNQEGVRPSWVPLAGRVLKGEGVLHGYGNTWEKRVLKGVKKGLLSFTQKTGRRQKRKATSCCDEGTGKRLKEKSGEGFFGLRSSGSKKGFFIATRAFQTP